MEVGMWSPSQHFPYPSPLAPQTPIYSERVLPLPGCFSGLRECRIRRKGVGEEEKKKVHGMWLGRKLYRFREGNSRKAIG